MKFYTPIILVGLLCCCQDNNSGLNSGTRIGMQRNADSTSAVLSLSPIDALEGQIIKGEPSAIFDPVNPYALNIKEKHDEILAGVLSDRRVDSSAVFEREIEGKIIRSELRYIGADTFYSVVSILTTSHEDFDLIRRSLIFLNSDQELEFRYILNSVDDVPDFYKSGNLIWDGSNNVALPHGDCIDLPSGNTACKSFY